MTNKCIVYGHLGMGDMYWMNGAVRFFSTIHDEVVVLCKTHNVKNTQTMYEDDSSIIVWPIPHDIDVYTITSQLTEHVMIACGLAAGVGAAHYPDSFYTDMNLDPKMRTIYFRHAHCHEAEILKESLTEPYVVIHESKSSASIDLANKFDLDKQLVINICHNVYPMGHHYYDMAQRCVNRPLPCYIEILQHAEELHLIESSLACLAIHLDLSEVEVKKIYEASSNFINLNIFTEGKI